MSSGQRPWPQGFLRPRSWLDLCPEPSRDSQGLVYSCLGGSEELTVAPGGQPGSRKPWSRLPSTGPISEYPSPCTPLPPSPRPPKSAKSFKQEAQEESLAGLGPTVETAGGEENGDHRGRPAARMEGLEIICTTALWANGRRLGLNPR